MEEILLKLKAPFPVEKLSWRVGQKSNWDKVKNCLSLLLDYLP